MVGLGHCTRGGGSRGREGGNDTLDQAYRLYFQQVIIRKSIIYTNVLSQCLHLKILFLCFPNVD